MKYLKKLFEAEGYDTELVRRRFQVCYDDTTSGPNWPKKGHYGVLSKDINEVLIDAEKFKLEYPNRKFWIEINTIEKIPQDEVIRLYRSHTTGLLDMKIKDKE